VPLDAALDIYVLNTCTVTHIADRKCRHLLRMAHRQSPDTLIVVTGCYAQRAPQELGQIDGVALVVGNEDKGQLVELIGLDEQVKQRASPQFRTRTMVKIQDGCRESCSYCIVPQVRGRGRDVPPDQVVAEVEARVAEGYKELILTGTQIGDYGGGLEVLVQRILAETGVERLRLSSLQPQNLSPSFLHLWCDNRLCRHLHLPLQSGSDAVLRRMRRRYTAADYERAVTMAREMIPGLAVSTDVMVGFPGESDEEFDESLCFCERMGFARLHIFSYSARPGTVAAQMANQIGDGVKKERSRAMLKLAQESAPTFRRQFLGQELLVLWEGRKNGVWIGHTDNYISVLAQSEEDLSNRLLPTKLVDENKAGLWGEPYLKERELR
jgi:threonylcarbamoyladenosine tRNA methylthiotransferase MtaB